MLPTLASLGTGGGTGNLLHDSHKLVPDYPGEPHVPGWRTINHVGSEGECECDRMTPQGGSLGTGTAKDKLQTSVVQ